MDSLPQELIEAIIDNIPRSTLHSSSLVARRWRTRSQQCLFDHITFCSEDKMNRWHSDVQGGRNRIVSYVRSAEFHTISRVEPTLVGYVLKGLRSLKTLRAYRCPIPDDLPGQISRGEFGRGITTLSLISRFCDPSTITSMILSLPELKKLTVTVDHLDSTPRRPLPTSTVSRRSLDLLELYHLTDDVAETLIQSQFTFRYICLGGGISRVHQLLAISSRTLVALTLKDDVYGIFALPTCIDLPSFPALTSLRIHFDHEQPSHRIVTILSSIYSTPVLASVDIRYEPYGSREPTTSDTWNGLDRWLARVAEHTAVECGLVLNLRQRISPSESSLEALFPRFREAGGEIKINTDGCIDYD